MLLGGKVHSDPHHFLIRPMEPRDDTAVAAIIRAVMPEFGAGGEGFAIHDSEVDAMCAAYAKPRSAYFVLEVEGKVVGGGGVAPLEHGEADVCELRKMYFLPQARGLGAGSAMITRCLDSAREFGFKRCYLETLTGMDAAQALYRKHGFTPLCAPMGDTGHHGCDRWFLRTL
ncbi:MAG TPA: GNAT family N-acetyltransferase [Rhodanobacteraceae bacterium]|nr:GNAT family N-acetyltransferase [Rhodanobacteraceae bacterium]